MGKITAHEAMEALLEGEYPLAVEFDSLTCLSDYDYLSELLQMGFAESNSDYCRSVLDAADAADKEGIADSCAFASTPRGVEVLRSADNVVQAAGKLGADTELAERIISSGLAKEAVVGGIAAPMPERGDVKRSGQKR